MSSQEKRLLERQDGGGERKRNKVRKKKEQKRDAKEMNWCLIFSYNISRDSGRDVRK
jgi:hypothetical protein